MKGAIVHAPSINKMFVRQWRFPCSHLLPEGCSSAAKHARVILAGTRWTLMLQGQDASTQPLGDAKPLAPGWGSASGVETRVKAGQTRCAEVRALRLGSRIRPDICTTDTTAATRFIASTLHLVRWPENRCIAPSPALAASPCASAPPSGRHLGSVSRPHLPAPAPACPRGTRAAPRCETRSAVNRT